MRNILGAVRREAGDRVGKQTAAPSRSLTGLLAPVDEWLKGSPNLLVSQEAQFERGGKHYFLPRYFFIGPQSGDAPIRMGIFAGVSGEESKVAFATIRFLKYLETYAETAEGYYLSVYPVCNPAGYEDGTRLSRQRVDLNHEFRSGPAGPEAALLQGELASHSFHIIVSLQVDDSVDGFYADGGGTILTKHLIEPAQKAAETFLPRAKRGLADSFPTRTSGGGDSFPAVLRAPPGVRPRPFEIAFKAPEKRSAFLTELAFVAALQSILAGYRNFIAYARNL